MLLTHRLQLRLLLVAEPWHKSHTTWMERAPRRPVIGMWYGAADRGQSFARVGVNPWNRAQEGLSVWMFRVVKNFVHGCLLDDAAQVHDHNGIGHLGDHAQSWVMSMIAIPYSRCSWRMRSRICAWVVTSSAVVGSSAISRVG